VQCQFLCPYGVPRPRTWRTSGPYIALFQTGVPGSNRAAASTEPTITRSKHRHASARPHVVMSLAPQDVFLDPSHIFRLWLDRYRPSPRRPRGFVARMLSTLEDAEAIRETYLKRQVVPRSTPASRTVAPNARTPQSRPPRPVRAATVPHARSSPSLTSSPAIRPICLPRRLARHLVSELRQMSPQTKPCDPSDCDRGSKNSRGHVREWM
jgi:hypothetical protein